MVMNHLVWTRLELWPWALAVVLGALILAGRAWAILGRVRRQYHWSLLIEGRSTGGYWRALARALALCSFAVALLGPSYGYRDETVTEVSRPVILAVDMSKSVRAMDIAPDRLTRIREVVANLMASFPGYKYALILFAGDARYRVPFTYDYGFIQFVLNETKPEDVQPQGTDLRAPLELAVRIADTQQLKEATLILVTDGEHTGQGDPVQLIPYLRDRGIRVLAVAVGDPAGAPIPLPGGGYVKDKQGDVVFSKPDLDLLQRLATGTGGLAHMITGREFDLNPLAPLLAQIEAARGKQTERRTPIDRAEWPLGLGVFLFALSLLPLTVFARRQRQMIATPLLLLLACSADRPARQALQQNRPAEAAAWYAKRAAETGEAAALANLGAALFAQENFATAATAFVMAATRESYAHRRGDDLYNAGNAYFKAGDLQKAVELYEAALKERDDEDTAFNLELAKRLLEQLQQDQQQQQQQNQKQQLEDQQQTAGEQQQFAEQGQEQVPQQAPANRAAQTQDQQVAPQDKNKQLGVLLQQRIDRLQEANPMKLKGQGADAERPW